MQISLSGVWKATEDLGQQAKAGKPGYNDAGWHSVSVPGHWQEAPGLEQHTGVLLYRKSFAFTRAMVPGEAVRLRFEGIFYDAKVWLNGAFLGEQQGYFAPESYAVTRHIHQGENVVMVEVACPTEESPHARKLITGIFSEWACKHPGMEPGGIWRDVSIEVYHGVVPEKLLVSAVPERLPHAPMAADEIGKGEAPAASDGPVTATAGFELEFSAVEEGNLTWTATIQPETFEGEPLTLSGSQPARRGWNRLQASLAMLEPRLWWTWDHGRPDLYRFTLDLSWENGPVQRMERLFGVRRVEMRKWHFYLNGRRIFLRGTSYGPADMRLARVKRERYAEDLQLMIAANVNMARVHAHVDKPELYEEASRMGVLLWQDFPLHHMYVREVKEEAKRQARRMVEELGHWPAIGLWCCHNDPGRAGGLDEQYSVLDRSLAALHSLAGGWNRSTLDPALREVIRSADPTRPCLTHPSELAEDGGRIYLGWSEGKVEELKKQAKRSPEKIRWVSEFGAQAFPAVESSHRFVSGQWPNINWDDLTRRHMLLPKTLEKRIPHTLAQTFEEYVDATQRYQAFLHKFYIEQFRRWKYHPTGGVIQFMFADSAPGVTWSIVDYWRVPKLAYQVVRESFQPIYILADWPEPGYAPGKRVALQVFLINDRYHNYHGTWSWEIRRGERVLAAGTRPAYLAPDSAVPAPEGIDWTVPEGLSPGAVELVLTLEPQGADSVSNRYLFGILSPP
jgi:beta-mannosidase